MEKMSQGCERVRKTVVKMEGEDSREPIGIGRTWRPFGNRDGCESSLMVGVISSKSN